MAWFVGLITVAGGVGTAGAAAVLLGLGVLHGVDPGAAGIAAFSAVLLLGALAGGAFRAGERVGALSLIAASWAPLVIVVLALHTWEPADAREAAHTGLTSVLPASLAAPAVRIADRLFPAAPAPPVRATFVPAPVRAKARNARFGGTNDEVVVPYEGAGHSLAVQVGFTSARGEDLDVGMLFDTGATLTTLNRATLHRLGIPVPVDAPVIELHTANGPARVPVVRVPRLWIGGIPVEDVTVGVCEPCADARVSGLLGLNVTGRFLVTLDTHLSEITLVAREATPGPVLDLQPWVDLDAAITRWPDGRTEAVVRAHNAATREVSAAEVRLTCGTGDAADDLDSGEGWIASLGSVPARGHATVTVRIPAGEAPEEGCDRWRVRLEAGSW